MTTASVQILNCGCRLHVIIIHRCCLFKLRLLTSRVELKKLLGWVVKDIQQTLKLQLFSINKGKLDYKIEKISKHLIL